MTKKLLQCIYKKRVALFLYSQLFLIAMILFSLLWVVHPQKAYEPLIVLFGFLYTMSNVLPTAIKTAFPTISYKFSLKIRIGEQINLPDGQIIFGDKDDFDLSFSNPKNPILQFVIKNESEETMYVKSILLTLKKNKKCDPNKFKYLCVIDALDLVLINNYNKHLGDVIMHPGQEYSGSISNLELEYFLYQGTDGIKIEANNATVRINEEEIEKTVAKFRL